MQTHRDLEHDANSQWSVSARGLRQGQEVLRYHTQSICKRIIHALYTLLNGSSMQAVKEISASFKPYTSVPRINQLWKRTQELQGEIRTLLESDFDT
jgi:hypothetical protein